MVLNPITSLFFHLFNPHYPHTLLLLNSFTPPITLSSTWFYPITPYSYTFLLQFPILLHVFTPRYPNSYIVLSLINLQLL